jgi:hypothetical protein
MGQPASSLHDLVGAAGQLPEFLIGFAFLAGMVLGRGPLVVANRIALAFFPLRAYLRRIETRAAQQVS